MINCYQNFFFRLLKRYLRFAPNILKKKTRFGATELFNVVFKGVFTDKKN